jgi:long-subunit acyl-CoA synthetase (AMP-forming)
VKKLTDDVAALKPSLFVAVPRVLERIQSGIVAKLKKKPWIVRFIFNIAYRLKSGAVRGGKPVEKVSYQPVHSYSPQIMCGNLKRCCNVSTDCAGPIRFRRFTT